MNRLTLCLFCGLALTQLAATPAPRVGLATQSGTAPAPPRLGLATRPDRSSPEKTWGALCAAVKTADLAAFRACCYNKNAVSTYFMDAYSDTVVTSFQLAASVAKLGDQGKAMSKDLESTYTDLVKSGENRTAQITGDSCKWVRKVASDKLVAEQAMYFKKVGNEWLLDTEQTYNLFTADGRKAAEDFVTESEPTLKLLKTVIAEIDNKKITTVQQMKDRMAGK